MTRKAKISSSWDVVAASSKPCVELVTLRVTTPVSTGTTDGSTNRLEAIRQRHLAGLNARAALMVDLVGIDETIASRGRLEGWPEQRDQGR